MAYNEDLIKLRKRVIDATNAGVVQDNVKDFYEATLIQIMNESERQRQTCVARAEDLRRQAAIADGQAAAFSQTGSIIYSVLNGYVNVAEKQKREELEASLEKSKQEEESNTSEVVEENVVEEKSKTSKKKSNQ